MCLKHRVSLHSHRNGIGTSNLELPCLDGDLFVGTAEDVLRLHCKLLSMATIKQLPICLTTNLALRDGSKQNAPRGSARGAARQE
jgi:hypothetical protein